MPAPAQNDAIESSHTDGATTSTSTCPARGTAQSVHATSGRLGRIRKRDEAADNGADARDGEDRPPGAGAAEVLVRDHGAEHEPGAEAEVADPEQDHRRPEPRSAR